MKKVNARKSFFYLFSRVTDNEVNLVSHSLSFQWQRCPFVYLGEPISTGRVTCVLFYGILDKICKRLGHWSTRLLSHDGKMVLIRHVSMSIQMYLLQVLQPLRQR